MDYGQIIASFLTHVPWSDINTPCLHSKSPKSRESRKSPESRKKLPPTKS